MSTFGTSIEVFNYKFATILSKFMNLRSIDLVYYSLYAYINEYLHIHI